MSGTRRSWLAVAAVMFGVGWGANQFTSLLIAYHQHLGLALSLNEALFGVYALGLIPALLVGGPASDRWGRRTVVRPAAPPIRRRSAHQERGDQPEGVDPEQSLVEAQGEAEVLVVGDQ